MSISIRRMFRTSSRRVVRSCSGEARDGSHAAATWTALGGDELRRAPAVRSCDAVDVGQKHVSSGSAYFFFRGGAKGCVCLNCFTAFLTPERGYGSLLHLEFNLPKLGINITSLPKAHTGPDWIFVHLQYTDSDVYPQIISRPGGPPWPRPGRPGLSILFLMVLYRTTMAFTKHLNTQRPCHLLHPDPLLKSGRKTSTHETRTRSTLAFQHTCSNEYSFWRTEYLWPPRSIE